MNNTFHKGLGRREPTDWKHYENYPLRRELIASAVGPVVWGVNWYKNFDYPVQDQNGEYWIGQGDLGSVLGGHCIAQPYSGARDLARWYSFYDQGNQGACVGFGWSRAMSWFNRRTFDANWLYEEAKRNDEWPGEDYDGTSVRAGAEVLRQIGHRRVYNGVSQEPNPAYGITTYRWTNSVQDALDVVGGEQKRRGAVAWRNSWGSYYPQKVWVPAEVAQRLIDENGEIAIPTDK